jgi:hypothetical protein
MKRCYLLLVVAPWLCCCGKSAKNQASFDPEKAALKAATLKERPVTIQSRPILRQEDGLTWLEASQGEIDVTEMWAREGQSPPVKLDPTTTYQFDLLEQPYLADPNMGYDEEYLWVPCLIRILDSGQVIHDASICALHKVPMKREVVPIQYGFPAHSNGFVAARKNRFPNATPYLEGGCCVGPDRTARVFRCERCIEEQKTWEAEHPEDH